MSGGWCLLAAGFGIRPAFIPSILSIDDAAARSVASCWIRLGSSFCLCDKVVKHNAPGRPHPSPWREQRDSHEELGITPRQTTPGLVPRSHNSGSRYNTNKSRRRLLLFIFSGMFAQVPAIRFFPLAGQREKCQMGSSAPGWNKDLDLDALPVRLCIQEV